MKKSIITIVLGFLLLATTTVAQNYQLSQDHPKYDRVVANLIEGLTSDNEGLKFSCAYALGEIKADAAVNALTNLLRTHDDVNYKIMAALSLSKIGTERSLYMVKRVGKFTNENKLATFCDKFYASKKFPLPQKDQQLVVALFK